MTQKISVNSNKQYTAKSGLTKLLIGLGITVFLVTAAALSSSQTGSSLLSLDAPATLPSDI